MNIFTHSKPGLFANIVVAVALSFIGALLLRAINVIAPGSLGLKLTIIVVSTLYLLYLLSISKKRSGRTVLLLVSIVIPSIAFIGNWSLLSIILTQGILIWLVRSLTRYNHLLPAVVDGGLLLIGLAFAFWALVTTGSFFATLWCFYLAQSIFPFIPNRVIPFAPAPSHQKGSTDLLHSHNFSRSLQSAQGALVQLSNRSL